MLEMVRARRFDRKMTVGRTGPCLMAAEREDGAEVEVVVKFSAGCELRTDSLSIEAIAAMLGADLDLPVPEPFLVSFDSDFVSCLSGPSREVAVRLQASSPVAFGSKKLPSGYNLVLPGKPIPRELVGQAADIFAFDAFIENPDRSPENPNCLSNGRSYAIIDHELAFRLKGIIGRKPAWDTGALELMKSRHLFFPHLSGKRIDFKRLEGAWKAISDSRLREYRAALPPEWMTATGVVDDTLGHIAQIRDTIEAALAEAARVLS